MLTYLINADFPDLRASCEFHDVYACKILEREGKRPTMSITVNSQERPATLLQCWIQVFFAGSSLFVGRVIKEIKDASGELLTLKVVCDHPENPERTRLIAEELASQRDYTAQLYSEEEHGNLGNFLNTRLLLPAWDRRTGIFTLTSIFEGEDEHEVNSDTLLESHQKRLMRRPLKAVNIIVKCRWAFHYEQTINVMRELPGGEISTVTPLSFERSWPKEGMYLPGTSLQVSYSSVGIARSIGVSHISCVSPTLRTPIQHPIEVYAYSPKLEVVGRTQTAVREIFRSCLRNSYQRASESDPVKDLVVDLGAIEPSEAVRTFAAGTYYESGSLLRHEDRYFVCLKSHTSAAMFDATLWSVISREIVCARLQKRQSILAHDASRRVMRHLTLLARSYLANSSRCVETNLSVCPEIGMGIRTLDGVKIGVSGDGHPELKGKVTEVRIALTSENQSVELKVASAIGTESPEGLPGADTYADELVDYAGCSTIECADGVPDLHIVPDHYDLSAKHSYKISDVVVENPAEEQLHSLRQTALAGVSAESSAVESTTIRLHAGKSMENPEVLIQHRGEYASAWSAPKQIDLEGA